MVLLGDEQAPYFIRSAVDKGRDMASRLVTSVPANPSRSDLPTVQAVFILFDEPRVVLW